MGFNNSLHDVKAEPRAGTRGLVGLPETIKKMREMISSNPASSVGYDEHRTSRCSRAIDADRTARVRELRCISDEVGKHLTYTTSVDGENEIFAGP